MAVRISLVKLILTIAGLIVAVQVLAMFQFSSMYPVPDEHGHYRRKSGKYMGWRSSDGHWNSMPESAREAQSNKLDDDYLRYQGDPSTIEEPSRAEAVSHFKPPCQVRHKDALSAIKRAKTEKCRQEIINVACQSESGELYFSNLTRLCPVARSEGRPAHSIGSGSGYGPPIRIAYVLTVHGRAFRQVKRLFKALYHSQHYFYFHVDSRSNFMYRQLQGLTAKYANVALAPWRMATIWGGASLLKMLLQCMVDLLNKPNWKWDFFINLSESDYPVQTNERLVRFLRAHRDENFLKPHGGSVERFIRKQGIDRTFYECDEHMWRLGERRLPPDIDIDGGSDWVALNRKFCEYVIHSDHSFVIGLKQLYKYALLPAESFFHTVLRNSPLCKTFVKSNLRLTNWKRKLGCRCQYKHIVDWCGCSPNDFKPEDFPRLKSQTTNFFARKFESIISQEIVSDLDQWLYGKLPPQTPALHNYWENIFHQKDDRFDKFDVYQTFFQSFARIATKHLSTQSSQCLFSTIWRTKEAHYYQYKDILRGVLVSHDIKYLPDDTRREFRTIEVWMEPVNTSFLYNANMSLPANRLKGLEISTSWDQKERVFRNYARMIGPYDNPTLVHRWVHGQPFHVRIIWEDPLNVITGIYQMKVEENWVISFHKPTFNKPLRPGTWKVKLVYNDDIVIGETSFVVVPKAYHKGKPVTLEDAVTINNGPPAGLYSADFVIEFDREANDTDIKVREFAQNAYTTGSQLDKWVDSLILQHWKLKDICAVGETINDCGLEIISCHQTEWSSLSIDPKSELGIINVEGRIR